MLYGFGKSVCSVIFRSMYKVKAEGTENIPKEGPVIICSNHISNFDPPIVGITTPRHIHFMAKEELFEKKGIGWILQNVKAFPVKRGMRDRQALRNGLDILKDGGVLGLFPEGTRSKTGEVGKGLAGAGFFALRSNATVIPCAIIGPYEKRNPLKVVYGPPVEMETFRTNKASAQEVTDEIMASIAKIKKNAIN